MRCRADGDIGEFHSAVTRIHRLADRPPPPPLYKRLLRSKRVVSWAAEMAHSGVRSRCFVITRGNGWGFGLMGGGYGRR